MPHSVLTRRTLLTAACAVSLLAALGAPRAWAATPGEAQSLVKNFADQLVGIVNGPQPAAAKKAALGPVIDSNVDVPRIARFCLGRFWASASPTQQQQYVSIFHGVLLNSISGHLGDYTGVSYSMSGAIEKGDTTLVGTSIVRPNAPAANVQWVVDAGGKVVDVIAEGTSLRLTTRQDYSSFLGQHGNDIGALLSSLQQKLDNPG